MPDLIEAEHSSRPFPHKAGASLPVPQTGPLIPG